MNERSEACVLYRLLACALRPVAVANGTRYGLAAYVWTYEPGRRSRKVAGEIAAEAVALSKDLKKRGWTFVGPTTVYAFMQAMGMVNDHAEGCVVRPRAAKARRAFARP